MQTDPVGYVDGPNLYTYVNNNPISYADPNGLTVVNLSSHDIWIKVEDEEDLVSLGSGDVWYGKQEGIAVPFEHPGEIFKSAGRWYTSGIDLVVLEDGSVETQGGDLIDQIMQAKDGGWKDCIEWVEEHSDWKDLCEKSH